MRTPVPIKVTPGLVTIQVSQQSAALPEAMHTYGRFTPAPNTNFGHSGYQVSSQQNGPGATLANALSLAFPPSDGCQSPCSSSVPHTVGIDLQLTMRQSADISSATVSSPLHVPTMLRLDAT